MQMTLDEYARHLGGLVGNYQSLEFMLRAYLQELPTARPIGSPHGVDIYSFPVGKELPENELTSYDSLGQLIDKFNGEMRKHGLSEIDRTLVEVRDALAHGRVSSGSIDETLRLLKFDKPVNGRVRIVFNEKLTGSWFATQTRRVYEAIQLIARVMS